MGKFVKFTSIYTEKPVCINVDDISSFYEDEVRLPNTSMNRPCTKIFMDDGKSHTIEEQYKEVEKAICGEFEQKKGHWINTGHNDEWYYTLFQCSECGGDMIGLSDFCPHCGADMRENHE